MIKKILLVLVLVLTLSACRNDETPEIKEDILFNEITYVFNEVSSDGYDLYVGDNKLLEVLYVDEEFIISTEIYQDIFIITGNTTSYQITKNGAIILIDGIDLSPTGSEMVSWNSDIIPLMEQYLD